MGLWCRHRNETTPRKDEKGEYRRCLDCGARLPWSWGDKFPLHPPRLVQPKDWEAFCRSLGIEEEAKVKRL